MFQMITSFQLNYLDKFLMSLMRLISCIMCVMWYFSSVLQLFIKTKGEYCWISVHWWGFFTGCWLCSEQGGWCRNITFSHVVFNDISLKRPSEKTRTKWPNQPSNVNNWSVINSLLINLLVLSREKISFLKLPKSVFSSVSLRTIESGKRSQ